MKGLKEMKRVNINKLLEELKGGEIIISENTFDFTYRVYKYLDNEPMGFIFQNDFCKIWNNADINKRRILSSSTMYNFYAISKKNK